MKRHIVVFRTTKRNSKQTIGKFMVLSNEGTILYSENCLERGWLNNKVRESCIPPGKYPIVLEMSAAWKKELWEIKNVPGRSECKIHLSNYWHEINGCIALGLGVKDINRDGLLDMTNSKNAVKSFHAAMGDQRRAYITIIDL